MTSASAIQAIPTYYGGTWFRSRLEARWAVFFTRLSLDWEYEAQGWYVGPTRRRYLPDFFLPQLGAYFEVKPADADQVDPTGVGLWETFAADLAEANRHDRSLPLKHPGIKAEAVISCGPIPDPDTVDHHGPPRAGDVYTRGLGVLDEPDWAWCACPSGLHVDLQHLAVGSRICCECQFPGRPAFHSGDDIRILNAYGAARTARFEHDEKPDRR